MKRRTRRSLGEGESLLDVDSRQSMARHITLTLQIFPLTVCNVLALSGPSFPCYTCLLYYIYVYWRI